LCGGGELAGGFAVGFQHCGQCRGRVGELELRELAVDLASGADALDDLLAEVAALGEVQRVGLAGLLREVFRGFGVADVDAVLRGAFE
jgi:hypothetical protein